MFCCREYRDTVHGSFVGDEGRFCDGCGDEQLSVGDDRYVPSKGQCDLKYYTRSFKPTSYDGAYIQAKEEITKNQTEEDVCVLNYEDEVLRAFGEKLHTQVLYFSSRRKLERGIYLEDGKIIYADGKPEVLCKVEELKLLGTHNYENVMAASAMAAAYGVPLSSIRETIRNFGGVAHRIEFVTEKEGVAYYNDSKGTNPDAAIKAVEAMNRPTILIGGGYDKNSSYDEWIDSFGEK